MGSDAHARRVWPSLLVRYLDSVGRIKVLFGTDWPVIDPERAIQEIKKLGIREESLGRLLRDNALSVFRLPENG